MPDPVFHAEMIAWLILGAVEGFLAGCWFATKFGPFTKTPTDAAEKVDV